MSEEQLVLVETSGGVCTLTFNRPEKKNAFSLPMYTAAVAALREAGADPAVRVVLLTGAGGAFTAGNDLADFAKAREFNEDHPAVQLLLALLDFDKPLVAAVNGVAVGVGVTMLLHCDLVYLADDAKLLAPFVGLGLVPEGGSSLLLPRIAGMAKASEILLLAEPFDAATAVSAGLAARALPPAELLPFARKKAARLAELPAAALRASKKLLRDPLRDRLRDVMFTEAARFAERLSSPEAKEAFAAFFEKRKPDFSKLG